jgi:hypothetical protein
VNKPLFGSRDAKRCLQLIDESCLEIFISKLNIGIISLVKNQELEPGILQISVARPKRDQTTDQTTLITSTKVSYRLAHASGLDVPQLNAIFAVRCLDIVIHRTKFLSHAHEYNIGQSHLTTSP